MIAIYTVSFKASMRVICCIAIQNSTRGEFLSFLHQNNQVLVKIHMWNNRHVHFQGSRVCERKKIPQLVRKCTRLEYIKKQILGNANSIMG